MDEIYRVAVVDDVPAMRIMFKGVLREGFTVLPFESGRAFIESGEVVDAVLLDIAMPELNGYDTCRHLRARPEMARATVIFVSGHDSEEDRLAAYQAGGDDFVTKPIVADELRIKLRSAIAQRMRLRDLESQSSMAQKIAFSAMNSMGALGVILDFMRGSAEVTRPQELADRLIQALHAWGLRGAVRLRTSSGNHEAISDPMRSPLQASVMDALSDMGRIFQMRSRAVVNYPHVILLVENLPVDDEEALGRTRDNLAMLGETAEAMLRGLDAIDRLQAKQAIGQSALNEIRTLLANASALADENRLHSENQLQQLKQDVQTLLRGFGLTRVQESMIGDELERTAADMLQILDEATQIGQKFDQVIAMLTRLVEPDD